MMDTNKATMSQEQPIKRERGWYMVRKKRKKTAEPAKYNPPFWKLPNRMEMRVDSDFEWIGEEQIQEPKKPRTNE